MSFWRIGSKSRVLCLFNFTPVLHTNYRVGVDIPGGYREVLNSDADIYWGGNKGNLGRIEAQDHGWQGYRYSLSVVVPPLGVVILEPEHLPDEYITKDKEEKEEIKEEKKVLKIEKIDAPKEEVQKEGTKKEEEKKMEKRK